jgi:two-component system CheB/CheR fusion protein
MGEEDKEELLLGDREEEDASEETSDDAFDATLPGASAPKNGTDGEFEGLLEYLKRSRGFDFTGYKRASLRRRLDKRIGEVGSGSYAAYTDYLEDHSEEFPRLFDTVLINVTTFFRDSSCWEYLTKEIIPRLLAGKAEGDPVRLWSAGCASGQEPYSLAIILAEAMGWHAFKARVKIYATDIDEDALAQARSASYSAREVRDVPAALLEKYFDREGGRYVFAKDLRRCLIFGRHDLLQDSPISRIDLLTCRNTVMYFNSQVQAGIVARFHFAIKDGGFLFLGKAEMLFAHSSLFLPLDLRHRVFAKVTRPGLRDQLLLLASSGVDAAALPPNNPLRLWETAFQTASTAQIVLDISGRLAMVNERARALFHLSTRDIGRVFQDLEISYRPVELRSRIETAQSERRAVSVKDVPWVSGAAKPIYLEALIVPLQENGVPLGVSVSFTDVTRYRQLSEELQVANHEMEAAYAELQSANEELETTNEELQSTVEELETTNEELQSINEELETTSEEAQSTNEELQTVNRELNQRSDELNMVNAYMESIFASLRGGVVVLDGDRRVQIWNAQSSELWGLRPDEVQGAAFAGLDIGLPVTALLSPIEQCLSGASAHQDLTLEARNRRGQAFACRITLSPLLDVKRNIQGVILLMEPRV